jgi:glutathione synthase/RimK-type ligase-like ATP-grasp enzyme
MILLWGRPEEAPLADAREALARAGAEVVMFDERRALNATLRLSACSPDAGELCVDGRRIELQEVCAAYFRPYGTDSFLDRVELSRRGEVARRVGSVSASLWAWADVTRALVLNRPTLMASNASKPLQARMLAACGFETPVTLVTTDAGAARAFIAAQGEVIYKSISGTRSIVARLDPSKAARLDALACCPVQFQGYVPGVDVRVHVVGDEIFACELRSEADDYRYSGRSGQTTDVTAIDLPADIAALCRRASAALGLPLCGIDLRRTPDGRWVAFEVNPSPGYTYFASATGAPIARAIAALLMRGAG